ncbi:MAG: MFS transporter [Neisseriaceae bacterium]|nr:MFS transporter [Neisseriaceae bacterium]MBP6861133.1 MFS transporter [Neisseriaceae bacterium]
MTTITIVHKQNQIAIAADTQTTFGDDQRLSQRYDHYCSKIMKHKGSYIAIAGSAAHDLVLRSALKSVKKADLMGRENIFNTFCKLHPKLKEHFFLRPEEEEDDPYESSQMMLLIANESGIYGVYPMREVYQFKRFWSIGSGRKFAMGAMFAAYEQPEMTAKDLAELGVHAGAEFDVSTGMPLESFTLKAVEPEA